MKIAIIGAGILGHLLSYFAHSNGHQVTLFERQSYPPKNCSHAAGGLLCPFSEAELAPVEVFKVGLCSIDVLKQMHNDLPFEGFSQKGVLVVAHPQDTDDLIHFKRRLNSKVSTSFSIQQANAIEPELSADLNSLYFEQEGHVDPGRLMKAIFHSLKSPLFEAHFKRHVRITSQSNHGVKIEHEQFDWCLDARGLGAQAEWTQLYGVKGELIVCKAEQVHLTRPIRLVHPRIRLYVIPRSRHEFAIGATEIEGDLGQSLEIKTVLDLLSGAVSLHRGFLKGQWLGHHVQFRPTLDTHVPQIVVNNRIIQINGLYRHGFLCGPYLAQQVIEYLLHGNFCPFIQPWVQFHYDHANLQ